MGSEKVCDIVEKAWRCAIVLASWRCVWPKRKRLHIDTDDFLIFDLSIFDVPSDRWKAERRSTRQRDGQYGTIIRKVHRCANGITYCALVGKRLFLQIQKLTLRFYFN